MNFQAQAHLFLGVERQCEVLKTDVGWSMFRYVYSAIFRNDKCVWIWGTCVGILSRLSSDPSPDRYTCNTCGNLYRDCTLQQEHAFVSWFECGKGHSIQVCLIIVIPELSQLHQVHSRQLSAKQIVDNKICCRDAVDARRGILDNNTVQLMMQMH